MSQIKNESVEIIVTGSNGNNHQKMDKIQSDIIAKIYGFEKDTTQPALYTKEIDKVPYRSWNIPFNNQNKHFIGMYGKKAKYALLIFDNADEQSFIKMQDLLPIIKEAVPNAQIMLIQHNHNTEQNVGNDRIENFAKLHSLTVIKVDSGPEKTGSEQILQHIKQSELEKTTSKSADTQKPEIQLDNKTQHDTVKLDDNTQSSSALTQLKSSLNNLAIFTQYNQNIKTIHDILSEAQKLISNNKLNDAKQYLMTNKCKLETNILNLQSISKLNTLENVATTILTCVACLTILGIPLALLAWMNNLEKKGDCFMFFSKSAKQNAKVALNIINNQIENDDNENPSKKI